MGDGWKTSTQHFAQSLQASVGDPIDQDWKQAPVWGGHAVGSDVPHHNGSLCSRSHGKGSKESFGVASLCGNRQQKQPETDEWRLLQQRFGNESTVPSDIHSGGFNGN